MARRPRLLVPGLPLRIIQSGNNRSVCFYSEDDYIFFIHLLKLLSETHGCKIHAWCLMTNHVHLLLTPTTPLSACSLMKGLGQRYVQKYKSYLSKNRNSVGRSLSFLFGAARKLFDRYIEMNPVRAGIVDHPAEYRWTSYRANAQLEPSALITPHDCYKELGSNVDQRAEAYHRLFKDELQQEVIDQIRDATNGKRESLRRR